ncbi:MAG: hypothetical protein ACE5HV_02250, partial [Acidobacteriota bacterium]
VGDDQAGRSKTSLLQILDLEPIWASLNAGLAGIGLRSSKKTPLQFYFAVVSEDGELIDSLVQQVSWKGREEGAGLVPATRPSVYQHDWTLGFGEFKIRVLALDELSGRTGETTLRVRLPEPEGPWRVSEPILIGRAGDEPAEPILDTKALQGEQIMAYLEVFADQQPRLVGRILLPSGANELPVRIASRQSSKVHRAYLSVPDGLQPGTYTIQVTVSDPSSGKSRVFNVPLEIIGSN